MVSKMQVLTGTIYLFGVQRNKMEPKLDPLAHLLGPAPEWFPTIEQLVNWRNQQTEDDEKEEDEPLYDVWNDSLDVTQTNPPIIALTQSIDLFKDGDDTIMTAEELLGCLSKDSESSETQQPDV